MKKVLMSFVAGLVLSMSLMVAPQKAQASANDAANIILGVGLAAAVVALASVDDVQFRNSTYSCSRYGYYDCDYVYSGCKYQTVTTDTVSRSCGNTGYWNSYECVRSSSSSTTYIRTCGGW